MIELLNSGVGEEYANIHGVIVKLVILEIFMYSTKYGVTYLGSSGQKSACFK